jgi:hypothetical protein
MTGHHLKAGRGWVGGIARFLGILYIRMFLTISLLYCRFIV